MGSAQPDRLLPLARHSSVLIAFGVAVLTTRHCNTNHLPFTNLTVNWPQTIRVRRVGSLTPQVHPEFTTSRSGSKTLLGGPAVYCSKRHK